MLLAPQGSRRGSWVIATARVAGLKVDRAVLTGPERAAKGAPRVGSWTRGGRRDRREPPVGTSPQFTG
jgi:hypothetical protein